MAQIKVNQYSIPDDAITLAKMQKQELGTWL